MSVTPESEPRPEFRAHLEWQIASALRREERFTEPASAGPRRLRTAVAFLAALAIGAGAMGASGQVQEARNRDALIEALRTEESLGRLRLELAEAEYQDARRKYETGIASREGVQAAETQLLALKAALARLALNMEEIKATAQAPRDDLQAPLVDRRDFVSERLRLELIAAQQALVAAEQALEEAKKRVDVGLAPAVVKVQADVDRVLAAVRLQQLAQTLDLRRKVLGNGVDAAALATELRRITLTTEFKRAQGALDAARARLDAVRALFATGRVGELELKRAEVELLEHELDLKRIRQELEKIKK